jgi:ectoine hydroxylase-related dioxygenase (phytanoyl-CoA dioxygenase family)
MPKSLNETEQLNFLECIGKSGFAIIPDVLPCFDTERLVAELNQANLTRSRAGIRHAMSIASVNAVAHGRPLLEIARQILGPEAFPFRATLFDKSAVANWLVVWHQDTALPLRVRCETPGWGPWSVKDGIVYAHAPAGALMQVLALRLHLDDSMADNGPLRVLPETHTMGVLTDEAIHHLSTKIAPVDCLAFRGGVLAMRPLIVHVSSKSLAQNQRRVLHIEYSASAAIANNLRLAVA